VRAGVWIELEFVDRVETVAAMVFPSLLPTPIFGLEEDAFEGIIPNLPLEATNWAAEDNVVDKYDELLGTSRGEGISLPSPLASLPPLVRDDKRRAVVCGGDDVTFCRGGSVTEWIV
jgi:hypothetical protein